MYKAIWRLIFQLIPSMRDNVRLITVDYEQAAIKAAKECFRDYIRIKICLFHIDHVSNKFAFQMFEKTKTFLFEFSPE